MKKALYLITGLAWGVYFSSNNAIFGYAMFLSFATILVEIFVDEK